ncbi:uncharacterized protein L201_005640 [Kwoniella dendrophila CBS 6074]|uniref:Alpha 1,4-glycosyltransferase domain-containing protein n=1 Tax=Kwoniella dendrophila CBS 6074 TaxID=1295534 RepID=A0AAX4K1S7_9TREE
MVLPVWMKGGKPISIPISRSHIVQIPIIPLLLSILVLGFIYQQIHSKTYMTYQYTGLLNNGKQYELSKSPFLVQPKDFLPPLPIEKPGYLPNPLNPKLPNQIIPNSVHYVYGLKDVEQGKKGEELPYYAYLAIRSALLNLQPEKIYFHYKYLPTGPWWDLIEPHLTLISTQVPNEIYGKSLNHFAHKADVLRLLAMKYSGGIYLDIDIFVIKPFDDLLNFPTTLGMEASPDSRRAALDPEGLCNAIIISSPHSPFIERWLSSYETFDGGIWAHHSVVKPWQLARSHSEEIQVLNERAFFWPMWHGDEIKKVHEEKEFDFEKTGQYAYHAWESLAMGYLHKLSPHSIRKNDNSFNRMVRKFIGPEDDAVYKRWKGED